MKGTEQYGLVLFASVHHALKAEKILKEQGIAHKLIPVPKHISSDCGLCLRFHPDDKLLVVKALEAKVKTQEFCDL